ncbi:transglycosylase [Bacillus thuringiensis serovar roskildiensis]|uniref:Transglycosylase n=1 Tax=Bacillus thuringiensis serovar sooncheon TaxID=180891 RepID=A0A9Q5X459_BACTU|nr:transglycosylase [Bacillus thuringiensis]OTW68246.1 transglycosylase [Bacillus thuringiensis serovar coreanensis]OTX44863.1 transglycosylase [Bacillus thuringiensis serovar sooncheon]OTX54027.1 transglycosylase [Bacillus thuringiensis serovar guiyangiensis]OTX68347.1 transglycosylase [Bacillus thuringiensis serovar roskildiensis]
MKSVKFFLICWLCIHMCLLFPLQSQAEEQNVPEQKLNEVNVQEENKEVQEQPEQVEVNQDKEEQQEVANEQEIEKKIETDQGVITVNKPELKVGEEVQLIVEPKEQNVQSIKGILRLPKNGDQYEQERMLSFKYEEETKLWIANYKVEIFDLQGDWNLQLIQSYKENEKEELVENEVKVPLIRINNEMPTLDKELPKLHKVTIDETKGNVIERKQGDSIRVRVKATDVESAVKEVRVTLKGKENKEITFLLDYNKRDMDWQKVFEITDALPSGTYEILVEIVDAAGNKLAEESEYIVSVLEQKTEDDNKIEERENENKLEDKKETEKQEDSKVEIPLQEEKPPVVQIPKKEEKVNDLIKEPFKEKEKITYVIKEPLTDNKEVNKAKAQKDKDNNNQVISKKKEKKEEPEDKKEAKSEQGIQASNVFAIMSGLFVLFLVLKSNKEWG